MSPAEMFAPSKKVVNLDAMTPPKGTSQMTQTFVSKTDPSVVTTIG